MKHLEYWPQWEAELDDACRLAWLAFELELASEQEQE